MSIGNGAELAKTKKVKVLVECEEGMHPIEVEIFPNASIKVSNPCEGALAEFAKMLPCQKRVEALRETFEGRVPDKGDFYRLLRHVKTIFREGKKVIDRSAMGRLFEMVWSAQEQRRWDIGNAIMDAIMDLVDENDIPQLEKIMENGDSLGRYGHPRHW